MTFGYSLLINIHEKYYLFSVRDPGMHVFNFAPPILSAALGSSTFPIGVVLGSQVSEY